MLAQHTLDQAIAAAEEIDEARYADYSYAELRLAIENAKAYRDQTFKTYAGMTEATSAIAAATENLIALSQKETFSGEKPPDRLNSFSTQLASPFSQPSSILTIILEYPVCVISFLLYSN